MLTFCNLATYARIFTTTCTVSFPSNTVLYPLNYHCQCVRPGCRSICVNHLTFIHTRNQKDILSATSTKCLFLLHLPPTHNTSMHRQLLLHASEANTSHVPETILTNFCHPISNSHSPQLCLFTHHLIEPLRLRQTTNVLTSWTYHLHPIPHSPWHLRKRRTRTH